MTSVSKTSRRKRNPRTPDGDAQLLTKEKVKDEAKKARSTVLGDMDAIGYGVEAWFEEKTGYSRRLIETTVQIAQGLGVPEGEIERWVSSRPIRDMEKGTVIKSLLERLQRSFTQPHDSGNILGETI